MKKNYIVKTVIFLMLCFFSSKIMVIAGVLDFTSDAIPNYYFDNNWLDDKVTEVKNHQKGQYNSFVFITDMHFESNVGNSAKLIRYINDRTNLKFVLNGGDQAYAYGKLTGTDNQIDKSIRNYSDFAKSLSSKGLPVYVVRGNHDFTVKESKFDKTSPGRTLNQKDTYEALISTMTGNYKSVPNKLYYYFDDENNKTRYIVLDGYEKFISEDIAYGIRDYISKEQLNWLLNDALNVSNYRFVIVSHAPVDSNITWYSEALTIVHDIENAINNKTEINLSYEGQNYKKDFSNSNNIVLAHLNGHSHVDTSRITNNVLSFSTRSDALYNDGIKSDVDEYKQEYFRKRESISEQAFDIITINYSEKKIYATRIGGDPDRTWSFTDDIYISQQNNENLNNKSEEQIITKNENTNVYQKKNNNLLSKEQSNNSNIDVDNNNDIMEEKANKIEDINSEKKLEENSKP